MAFLLCTWITTSGDENNDDIHLPILSMKSRKQMFFFHLCRDAQPIPRCDVTAELFCWNQQNTIVRESAISSLWHVLLSRTDLIWFTSPSKLMFCSTQLSDCLWLRIAISCVDHGLVHGLPGRHCDQSRYTSYTIPARCRMSRRSTCLDDLSGHGVSIDTEQYRGSYSPVVPLYVFLFLVKSPVISNLTNYLFAQQFNGKQAAMF